LSCHFQNCSPSYTSADAEPLVAAIFRELGVSCPIDELRVKLISARQIAREIIFGRRNPCVAASYIEIAVCSWTIHNDELQHLFAIHDELNWDTSHGRSVTILTQDLLDTFARIAVLKLEND
jgi:hypothetical protein